VSLKKFSSCLFYVNSKYLRLFICASHVCCIKKECILLYKIWCRGYSLLAYDSCSSGRPSIFRIEDTCLLCCHEDGGSRHLWSTDMYAPSRRRRWWWSSSAAYFLLHDTWHLKKLHTEYGVLISMVPYFIVNLSFKAKRFSKECFCVHKCGISLLLPFSTHTCGCVTGSLLSTFYHIYAFIILEFPFYAIKILNYSLFHLWMWGLFLSTVSGLRFHTEITWEVDSVLLWMFLTLITNDTVCYVFLKHSEKNAI
jgi:hypothetical protein